MKLTQSYLRKLISEVLSEDDDDDGDKKILNDTNLNDTTTARWHADIPDENEGDTDKIQNVAKDVAESAEEEIVEIASIKEVLVTEASTAEWQFDRIMKEINKQTSDLNSRLKKFKPKEHGEINYAHIGSLNHILKLLQEINEFIGKQKNEYKTK